MLSLQKSDVLVLCCTAYFNNDEGELPLLWESSKESPTTRTASVLLETAKTKFVRENEGLFDKLKPWE